MQSTDDHEVISDAPPHVLRGEAAKEVQGNEEFVGRTVTIGKPREDLYEAWKDFTRFPQFMDNVKSVERLDGERSRWQIKGPAGKDVELVTHIVEDVPGQKISWESEDDSDVDTAGVVEFSDAPPGRGTYVRLLMSYDPPGGAIGRGIAKLLQREPSMQARRDLRRFKQLMENGEVAVNASPSARSSESPTEARI
ncbi:MAG: SRPBCC family protein [Sphingomonas sp.]|nr:SRPBCC family protein [Sphingomonas sp.]MBW0007850.1 SRPBCC family protein [Sphingomonas sp.]